jgi:ribosomal protein S18 acetylase RimI-like enzyme
MTWVFVDFDKKYNRSKFDCGEPGLNIYLKTQMSQDVIRKANVPVLAVNQQNEVIGFYTLSSGAVEFTNFPEALKKKIAPYPVPIARIGRLAVDNTTKGQGLGKELLFHAIDRLEEVSLKLGVRAIVVDGKNQRAEDFYLKYGFEYLQNTSGPRKSLFLIID